jgi:hypothetical protein
MGIWDKYKLNDLPEEHRAEVIKAVAHELEATNRAKIDSSNHQIVRGMAVVALALSTIPIAVVGYYWAENWKEVKVKAMTPMVCPPPPPCSAPPPPSFDIKVVPVSPASSAK